MDIETANNGHLKIRTVAKLFILECRSTGKGAITTMFGEKYAVSRTGNHWKERFYVKEGCRLNVIDISNTGKHNCFILMLRDGEFKRHHGVGKDGRCRVCLRALSQNIESK